MEICVFCTRFVQFKSITFPSDTTILEHNSLMSRNTELLQGFDPVVVLIGCTKPIATITITVLPLFHFLHRLMETAKEIIRESLPIKCLEAVMVALYLTVPLTTVQRFTIGFKSHHRKIYYRYVCSTN